MKHLQLEWYDWVFKSGPRPSFLRELFEVRTDGTVVYLGYDQMRARYRHDPRRAQLVKPFVIEPYVDASSNAIGSS